ncbi:lysozyme inhibitor LprI family protein [Bacteriovorax sp. PP10]|uniref:Lysozyme inhibitor LprI family protein n=1 Tax=Bacteriovorax antarcticus TaxID=3088717 RepID=A0ABU5W1Z5_9BACT|nr:lysozyme inhibitor LprI family protein [Bacteriovorax sp. PP10]MEA9358280.1 lysozyme inhibitor LprI family protein [Bacteriovorax sp. PP10]
MRKTLIVAGILILSTNIQAEVIKDTAKCDGTTVQMNDCLSEKIKAADKKLNDEYNKIMDTLKDKKQLNLLRQSQKAWLTHMTKEIEFTSLYFSGGTFGSIRAGNLKLDFLEKRARDLAELTKL